MFSRWTILLLITLTYSCKDKDASTKPETSTEEIITPKTKQQRLLEKTYKVQVSAYGDTLLPYIPQDSVALFFSRYGNQNPEKRVRMITKYGNIDFELYERTPLYRASFIFLVKNDYFDLTEVYRVVPDFVVQAGNSDDPLASMKRNSTGNYKLPPRFFKDLRHERGSLSLAKRWENNPEDWHNPFDFFISLSPSPHLDDAHTIFGRVTSGMEVADKIAKLDRDAADWPNTDVFLSMEVLD